VAIALQRAHAPERPDGLWRNLEFQLDFVAHAMPLCTRTSGSIAHRGKRSAPVDGCTPPGARLAASLPEVIRHRGDCQPPMEIFPTVTAASPSGRSLSPM